MSLITNENFKWFLVRDNFLSPKECDKLVESFDKEKKNISEDDEFKKLKNKSNLVVEDKELLDKLWNVIKLSNDLVYKFDISGIQISCGKSYSVDTYKEEEHAHVDFAPGPGRSVDTTTKLTAVVFLNDDYEGGELQVLGDKIPSEKGRLVIFPSFAAHKVLQFTKADRHMLISFAQGNTFK